MNVTEFTVLCEKYAIAPEVAIENEDLREALKARNDTEVERILKEEF